MLFLWSFAPYIRESSIFGRVLYLRAHGSHYKLVHILPSMWYLIFLFLASDLSWCIINTALCSFAGDDRAKEAEVSYRYLLLQDQKFRSNTVLTLILKPVVHHCISAQCSDNFTIFFPSSRKNTPLLIFYLWVALRTEYYAFLY